jgi:hypothetical protein
MVPTVPKVADMAPVMGSVGPWSLRSLVESYLRESEVSF